MCKSGRLLEDSFLARRLIGSGTTKTRAVCRAFDDLSEVYTHTIGGLVLEQRYLGVTCSFEVFDLRIEVAGMLRKTNLDMRNCLQGLPKDLQI
jgi:hypothetical protein